MKLPKNQPIFMDFFHQYILVENSCQKLLSLSIEIGVGVMMAQIVALGGILKIGTAIAVEFLKSTGNL